MTSEFPRGWKFTSEGNGGEPATITLSGVAGISHVLTSLHVDFISSTGGQQAFTVYVNGTSVGLILATAGPTKDTVDATLEFSGGPGNALAVSTDIFVNAGTSTLVVIQGYDI